MDKNDIMINGTGTSGGGNFNKAGISGSGKFTNDVSCEDFSCNGTGKVHGNLTSTEISIKGVCKIEGNVIAKELDVDGVMKIGGAANVTDFEVNGTASIRGDLHAEKLEVNGECKVLENVQSSKIEVEGMLSVGKSCACEKFTSNGKLRVGGLLTAEVIDIKLFWNSKIKEIGGHVVTIEPAEKFLVKLIAKFIKPKLKVEVIEADGIVISHTKAKIVRGVNVILGDDCEVDLVEYTESFTPGATAKFGKAVKL